jgi:glutathione S-transferase
MQSELTIYIDGISQPSRALHLFCLINKLPHNVVWINLSKGEHKSADFLEINPLQ